MTSTATASFQLQVAMEKLSLARKAVDDPVAALEATTLTYYDPMEILNLGKTLLAKHKSSVSEIDRFAIMEQVFVAALDTGDTEAASRILKNDIAPQFPPSTSVRSKRLEGMYLEATSKWDEAQKTYEDALELDETNMLVRKRLVALLRSRGKRLEAIEVLVKYLDAFTTDIEGWSELSALYLAEGMFQQAAFCLEEILLQRPQHHLYHLRYADILYTMGRRDLALKHYCRALELCTDNVRALYGIRLAAKALLSSSTSTSSTPSPKKPTAESGSGSSGSLASASDSSSETLEALIKLADERLVAVYEGTGKHAAELTSVVKGWLTAAV
ncbi:ER membrane complex subunit 2 [Quaeritorhiza haematococci]|nr:ER membrane complex subunit 2 [Quaeritorhiza haematococci]